MQTKLRTSLWALAGVAAISLAGVGVAQAQSSYGDDSYGYGNQYQTQNRYGSDTDNGSYGARSAYGYSNDSAYPESGYPNRANTGGSYNNQGYNAYQDQNDAARTNYYNNYNQYQANQDQYRASREQYRASREHYNQEYHRYANRRDAYDRDRAAYNANRYDWENGYGERYYYDPYTHRYYDRYDYPD